MAARSRARWPAGALWFAGIACVSGLLLTGVRPGDAGQAASGCEGCDRRAYVGRAEAGATGVALGESLVSRLAEALTSPCFHLQRPVAGAPESEAARFGAKAEPPEYVFEAEYEEGLNARADDGSAVRSRLTLTLFYDGEPRERVASWTVTSPINSFTACTNRMFQNKDAAMKGVRPIEALLEDFERRPASCQIHPGKTDLACGETMDLIIAVLRDGNGRETRPFNRIVVEAEKGEVLGGEPVEGRPRSRAFLVDDGIIELRYRAPGGETGAVEDVISVFSSCAVARPDRLPLSKTSPFRKIGESRLTVHCGAAPGTVVYRRTVSWDDTAANQAGSTTYKGSLSEEVTVRVGLQYTNTYKDNDYYRAATTSATYSFSYANDVFINGRKADVLSERVEDSGAFGPEGSASIELVVGRKSGAYTLQIGLRSREKQGRGSWFIGVNTLPDLLKGAVDGRSARGSYAAPAGKGGRWPDHRDNQGNDPGTSFSWNLELPDRK